MNRRILFDAVRRMLGRGFSSREVMALDEAIDRALADDSPHVRQVGKAGVALVKEFEGLARIRPDGLIEAYPDPATGGEPWTIGWGATGPDIGPHTIWTREQADTRFNEDIERHAEEVSDALGDAHVTQAQFDALVSFHYNTGAIRRATLTRKHIEGDYRGAAREFARWIYADGQILNGLIRRRRAEAELYRSG